MRGRSRASYSSPVAAPPFQYELFTRLDGEGHTARLLTPIMPSVMGGWWKRATAEMLVGLTV